LETCCRRGLRAGFVAAAQQLAGCHFVGTNAHNLDELHWSDGRHRRSGNLWTHYEYAAHVGFRGLVTGLGGKPQEESPKQIDDPLTACVDNLAELIAHDDSDPDVSAQKIDYCARIAVDDAWNISRELAVRELGRQGARLQLAQHPAPKPAGEVAGVDAVRDALRRLINTCAPVLKGGAVSSEELAEFAAACEAIGALNLDREGATRLLRSVAIIERGRSGNTHLGALHALSTNLQRACVRLALDAAVIDAPPTPNGGTDPGWNNPKVRAAALEACVEAYGEPAYAHFMTELSARDGDSEHLLALLRLVSQRGLPKPPPNVSDEERERVEKTWSETLLRTATDYPIAQVRLAAMAALAKVGGRASYSLREEDWQEWWSQRQAAASGNKAP
jgi:hypothetical protein